MIKTIIELKNIRSFLDFSAPEIEFGKKNILYAPNGTGKTNISRVFYKLSKNEPLDELLSQESSNIDDLDFKFKFGNNEVTKSNFESHKVSFENIYVFNSDYIEDTVRNKNFSEIDVSGEIKIPIGKKSNEIIEIENSIQSEKKTRKETKVNLEISIGKFKNEKLDSKEYTQQDINIWKELKIDNIINEYFSITPPTDNKSFTDCEEKFRKISAINENTSIDYSKLKEINLFNLDFNDIYEDLSTRKKFKIFDEEIKDNIESLTKDWIETNFIKKGIELSKKKNVCIFCERALDDSINTLFDKYQAYFQNEESKFKEKLATYSKSIEALKNQVLKINNNLENDVNDYSQLFNLNKIWSKLITQDILDKIDELEINIQKKRNDLGGNFSVLDEKGKTYDFSHTIRSLNNGINANLILVKKVITKFSKVKEEKTKLRTTIGKKFLHEFYNNNKSDFDKIIAANKKIKKNNAKLLLEQESLPKTKVSSNIKLLCNTFLHDFLYLTKYDLEDKDGLLLLKLNSHDISQTTQKISEGEKTMISLAFYLASSIQKFNSSDKFFNSIYVIDDPVNSTSYNYFFGVCNLLKHFDETIVRKLWKGDINKLQTANVQKIILSHNTQFFNVIRENVFKKNTNYFLLKNNCIKPIQKGHLKSEFEGALANIKKAITTKDFQKPIGNELRRFFETIKHFYGIKQFEAETLKLIFQGFEEKRHHIFYTVINYYSHSNPEAHTDPLPVNFEPFLSEFDELINDSQFKELWNNINLN